MALQVFSGKVSPEVAEQFKAAQENSEALTFNAFMEMLLEAYLNPKTKQVEVPLPNFVPLHEIQLKDNEIGQLKTAIDLKNQEIEALGEETRTLTRQLNEARAKQPEPLKLEENQVVLTIPSIVAATLKVEQEVAKKKSGKDFSIGDILLNNFWESIKNGASHPFRIWSQSELSNLAKQIKGVEQ